MIDPKTWKIVYHGPIDDRFAGKTAKPNAKVKKAYVSDAISSLVSGEAVKVSIEDAGGFFESILPGDPKVCSMQPRAGTQVLPGSDVTLSVARDC